MINFLNRASYSLPALFIKISILFERFITSFTHLLIESLSVISNASKSKGSLSVYFFGSLLVPKTVKPFLKDVMQ